MAKHLILIRHGRTGFSGRYIGSKDVPLSNEGRAQIEALGSRITIFNEDTLIASPMLRCRESCTILFPKQTVEFKKELSEIDFGRWEGLTFDEIVSKDKDLVKEWADWSQDFSFPDGENVGQFINRVQQAGEEINSLPEDNVIVVTHGGVIRALICYFLKLDPSEYLLFNVQKGRYATLDLFSEGAVLTGLNLGASE